MAMRETASSIRMYFLFVGIISGALNWFSLSSGLKSGATLVILLSGIGVLLSAAYFAIGLLMSKLMGGGAPVPKGVVAVNSLYLVGVIALLLQFMPPEQAGSASVQPAIGLLINWYLWSNLSRLSAEHDETPS